MLNRGLFRRLASKVGGEDNVIIVNEDVEMEATYTTLSRKVKGVAQQFHQLKPVVPGEEYRISCPFCDDTRNRLYVNHRWGTLDSRTKTRNWWLVQCYNEQCVSGDGYKLWKWLTSGRDEQVSLTHTKGSRNKIIGDGVIRPPGPPWSLQDMLKRNPRHPALTYLWDRLLDPLYVAETFDVAFIIESPYALCRNRLYAPVMMRGELVGWQCRKVLPSDKTGPKWFTSPGVRKGDIVYNYDKALHYSTKVVVEGPSDVWNFGAQAMGILGKSISPGQIDLICEMVTEPEDTVVLMLDPDLPPDHKEGKEHHIDRAFRVLSAQAKLAGRVIPIYLPPGTDPGMMDRYYMRRLIAAEAKRRKLKVSFSKREE